MSWTVNDNAIVTETQVKEYLGVSGTASDTQLQNAINVISQSFDTAVGYQLISKSYTDKVINGTGSTLLRFPAFNVTACTKAEYRYLQTDWTELDTTLYNLDEVNGLGVVGVAGYRFIKGSGNWRVAFTAGWAQVSMPGDIIEACLYEIEQFTEKRKAIHSDNMGGQSQTGKVFNDISINTRNVLLRYTYGLL